MTTFSSMNPSHHEPSSDPIADSDEELFGVSSRPHNTVATIPLETVGPGHAGDNSEDEHETIATMPLYHNPAPATQQSYRTTQPTQILPRPTYPLYSSPPKPHVQVIASSPFTSTSSARQPQLGRGIVPRGSAMAPAGTLYRQPMLFNPPRTSRPVIINDDDIPTYKGGSSDDEDVRRGGPSANVKTTTFQRNTNNFVAESPPAKSNTPFAELMRSFENQTTMKRPADQMADAYGNATKRPRQIKPSRAMPVQLEREPSPDEFDYDDIESANDRRKVKSMKVVLHDVSIRRCWEQLQKYKGDTDAAIQVTLEENEARDKRNQSVIDLISDDELNHTPAVSKNKPIVTTKQQAKEPSKSIADKWGSTQQPKRDLKPLDAFSPPKEPKPRRRLVRGRRDRSSPDLPEDEQHAPRKIAQTIVVDSDDDEDAASEEAPPSRNLTFEQRVLQFFNTCTAADLADTAAIKPALAEHFVSKQPFRSLDVVSNVDDPTRAPSKGKRIPVGERIVDKVTEMLAAYEAVDYLVQECDNIAQPLKTTMREWGVDANGTGEIAMTSMPLSPTSSGHDSGIGTPEEGKSRPRMKKPKDYFEQPAIMSEKFRLTDYQIVGMNWLNLLYQQGLSCILADDMGLGKTYQVIAFLSHLYETGRKGPHLVVVPAATLENWLMEFKKFSPKLKVEPYYANNPPARAELRFQIENAEHEINVLVTTYAVAKAKEDAPWLRDFGFDCTIFDEAHQLKNAASKVSRQLSRIDSDFRLLLTGTPLQNNLKELLSLLAFIMPDLFHQKAEDLEAIFEHTVKTMDDNHEALLSAQRIARARSILTPFILRRKKSQVARELPEKTSKVEFCDMTPEQNELYQLWKNKALSIRVRREAGETVGSETTHIMMKLRQASMHPWLFRRIYKDATLAKIAKQCLKDEQWSQSQPELILKELVEYSDMEVHTLCAKNAVLNKHALVKTEWLASGKVKKMLELLRGYIAEGSRTLIFSQFTMMLDILEVVLDHEQIRYFRMDGNTRVDQRQDLINTFSDKDNDTPVFMLSTKAGGAGINLAAANKVIIFDSGFNPQDDIQAENRAHRIGQKKPVEVVRLVTKNSVEESIYKMGLAKVELDQRVAGGMSGTNTPPNEVQESAAGQEKTMTQAELAGLQMVEKMFFEGLTEDKENGAQVMDEKPEGTSSSNDVQPPAQKKEGSDAIKIDDEDEVPEIKRETSKLPARAKRPGVKSKPGSQHSAGSSTRSSRSGSRK